MIGTKATSVLQKVPSGVRFETTPSEGFEAALWHWFEHVKKTKPDYFFPVTARRNDRARLLPQNGRSSWSSSREWRGQPLGLNRSTTGLSDPSWDSISPCLWKCFAITQSRTRSSASKPFKMWEVSISISRPVRAIRDFFLAVHSASWHGKIVPAWCGHYIPWWGIELEFDRTSQGSRVGRRTNRPPQSKGL